VVGAAARAVVAAAKKRLEEVVFRFLPQSRRGETEGLPQRK